MPDRTTMPDEHSGPDWIQLDALAESIGEDPGRWLDGPLDPIPRIRGLATIKAVRGWRAGARKVARIRNRLPRQTVLVALDDREAFLEDYEPTPRDLDAIPEKPVLYHTADGEVLPYDEVDRSGALARVGVATDGGEAGGE